jgi:hypothetical protein
MTQKTSDDFLDDIKAGLDTDRDEDYGVTPEEGRRLVQKYKNDTAPDAYKRINIEEFFDGS